MLPPATVSDVAQSARRRIARRLMPFLFLLYVIAFLDRMNIGAAALQMPRDLLLLIPFFLEGGRLTFRDVHYVMQGREWVPVGRTEFAQDRVFGYRSSNLRDWVEEKTEGRIPAAAVESISIDDIRLGGPEKVACRLQALNPGTVCIVNCVSIRDLEVFTLGLLRAESAGKHFFYRTAASFVAVRTGVVPRPLLSVEEVSLGEKNGGLIVAGSFVPKTTSQIRVLLAAGIVDALEMNARAVVNDQTRNDEVFRVARQASEAIRHGKDVIIFTSRELISGRDSQEALLLGQRISTALVDVVRLIDVRPRYVIAKGGITSSDIATRGLNTKRAVVRGQVLPGVPVWELGSESRFPGLPYVVFPGNVGEPDSLAQIVRMWGKHAAAQADGSDEKCELP